MRVVRVDTATVAGDGLLLIHPSTVIREAQPEDMAPVKAGPRPKAAYMHKNGQDRGGTLSLFA